MNHTIQGNLPRNKAVFAVFWETLGPKKICKEWELKKGHGVVYLTGAWTNKELIGFFMMHFMVCRSLADHLESDRSTRKRQISCSQLWKLRAALSTKKNIPTFLCPIQGMFNSESVFLSWLGIARTKSLLGSGLCLRLRLWNVSHGWESSGRSCYNVATSGTWGCWCEQFSRERWVLCHLWCNPVRFLGGDSRVTSAASVSRFLGKPRLQLFQKAGVEIWRGKWH